jgi:hypothetical protein
VGIMSDSEPTRTFLALLNGEIEYLNIAVCPATTRATRETPNVGIWRLSRERLIKIITPMVMDKPARVTSKDSLDLAYQGSFAGKTPVEVAILFDETGIENLFFRLHPEVARWIDETESLAIELDYMIL